ncbi:YdeI/OmpD-associated family protein [Parabacteroides sp. OttesenSCG-928-G07]|nr:YdeI/OmpD-associated family protein [Parabacteroides sp. OttesenSCG-928-G07]
MRNTANNQRQSSTEIKYFENRNDWRKWLTDNFETVNEVWFVFPQKSSGKKSITYNDAVEEALCFEWIDSTIKPLDEEHRIQRFTPRNPKSTYSQANKERLNWLLENKMIHPKFEVKIRNLLSVPFVFPNDIIDRLKEDKTVWKNYQQFSNTYKRIRIAYIEAARKRPEEFEKRLNNFIGKTKENKMIAGFGGIEKYY